MWQGTPDEVPEEWRQSGRAELAAGLRSSAGSPSPAYVWFEAGRRRSLTFAHAHERLQSLASRIRAAAVGCAELDDTSHGRGFTVGLVLRRTASLPLSQAACFSSGGTFVPCDPVWPSPRSLGILEEAGAAIVLVDAAGGAQPEPALQPLVDSLLRRPMPTAVLFLDDECQCLGMASSDSFLRQSFEAAHSQTATELSQQVSPSWSPPEVMYIMYTSGSTGKPKGCVVPTAGVWHRLRWGTKLLGFSRNDTFVLKTPATFDCSIPEMWVPLLLGCTSVLIPDNQHLDFTTVRETMERGNVTVAHFVPSVLALFLDFVSPGDLPNLRQISCTGEALLSSHRLKLSQHLGSHVALFNLYGPTEASIEASYFEVADGAPEMKGGFLPIGFPGDEGVGLYIVDPEDVTKLVPDGEQGEICIGGCQVAYGYIGRPDLTSGKFVPNPHGLPGLMYRTGDLGSRDPITGWFTCVGRADRQVKVGGVRIELGEIEAVLLRLFPTVPHVAVEKIDGRLVGVVAASPEDQHGGTGNTSGALDNGTGGGREAPDGPGTQKQPSEEGTGDSPAGRPLHAVQIQSALAAELPSSHVPGEWLFREALPLGSAGKVDHAKTVAWVRDQARAAVWGSVYDELYFAQDLQVADDGEASDPFMDWAAYTDSFTGKMHERRTIVEWVAETANEILARRPQRVVEMGCGKGMILFRVAADPKIEQYIGCDLSRSAVAHVERLLAKNSDGAQPPAAGAARPLFAGSLTTHVRDASNFGGIPAKSMDAVVCNGVSMYFPSAAYMVEVLANALPKLKPTGTCHVGDVISLQHLPLFLLRKARHAGASFDSLQDPTVRHRLLSTCKDRAFCPTLFYGLWMAGRLPGVAAVEVQLKHGAIMSEFTRYRYNVLLHMGEAVAPLAMATAPPGTESSGAREIATALAALSAAHPLATVACLGVPNARLAADVLLSTGVADAPAPAAQEGVGDGGGVDPALMRAELARLLPGYHAVLTWAKDGRDDAMDVYAFPVHGQGADPAGEGSAASTPSPPDLRAGLSSILAAVVKQPAAAEWPARCAGAVESFTNETSSVEGGADGGGAAGGGAGADGVEERRVREAATLWASPDTRPSAVLLLIASALRLPTVDPAASFTSSGGNSFTAMRAVAALRRAIGVSAPMLDLLTLSLGAFAAAVAAAAAAPTAAPPGWVDARYVPLLGRSISGAYEAEVPTFVFFPQAGSSPKQFARVSSELRQRCGYARFLFVQPPGRDARADEPNVSQLSAWLAAALAALSPHLVGHKACTGPTLFIGDSWGAIAAYAVAHAFRSHHGFTPTHMVVSGSASPAVASTQRGLGSFSVSSMAGVTDAELIAFLTTSGARIEEADPSLPSLLAAFRADCQLYEEYEKPAGTPPLRTRATVLRGADDQVTTQLEMQGWLQEFETDELYVLNIPGAAHHVYEEQPARVAQHLAQLVASCFTGAIRVQAPASRCRPGGHHAAALPSESKTLAPPCSFVSGVDPAALQAYREGYLRYRLGSAAGSKGELSQLKRGDDAACGAF